MRQYLNVVACNNSKTPNLRRKAHWNDVGLACIILTPLGSTKPRTKNILFPKGGALQVAQPLIHAKVSTTMGKFRREAKTKKQTNKHEDGFAVS